MRFLSPTLKEKKRYILFEVLSEEKLSEKQLFEEITSKYKDLYGTLGLSHAGLQLVSYDQNRNQGIIRLGHKFKDNLKSTFVLIDKINNKKVLIRSIKTSASINKLKPKTFNTKK